MPEQRAGRSAEAVGVGAEGLVVERFVQIRPDQAGQVADVAVAVSLVEAAGGGVVGGDQPIKEVRVVSSADVGSLQEPLIRALIASRHGHAQQETGTCVVSTSSGVHTT